jgi:N-acetylmuramoyl-L-alanine amidase
MIRKQNIQQVLFYTALVCLCASVFPGHLHAASPKQLYLAADNHYKQLRHSSAKKKYRSYWLKCIDKYQEIFKQYPSSSWAPAGMYRAAELYLKLFEYSYAPRDKQEAADLLKRIRRRYPDSAYSRRSEPLLRKIAANSETVKQEPEKEPDTIKVSRKQETIGKHMPRADRAASGGKAEKNRDNGRSKISDLRFWSNPDYTRVVIDVEAERQFNYRLLNRDPSINIPFKRLYIDIENAKLPDSVPPRTPIEDDLLKQARAGQHTHDSVRVVVDIKSFESYKIFSLKDPFRIVIDVWGEGSGGTETGTMVASTDKDAGSLVSTKNMKSSNIAKQFALGIQKIVIDPGHGGSDPGAPAHVKGVWEKDITLKLAKKLAKKLSNSLKTDVVLTRNTDRYLSLEERTAIANTQKADLFISLHCNAAENKRIKGMETYFLNLATDEKAIAVAARENATSKKNISDLETILNDLMKNAKISESSRLAHDVQNSTVSHMKKSYSGIKDLGVKQAPFYVLIGARMPSILIETAFISNRQEYKRMTSARYQEKLCDSITSGITKYVKETNPELL